MSRRGARGFTLVELLVTFAIAALLIGLVPVAFERMRESAQYRDTVRGVLAGLRLARHQALAEGRPVRFIVDLGQRRYGVEEPRHETPENLQLRVTVAGPELAPDAVAAIRFFPDGGATGGSIDIIRPSGDGVRLRVDWLFGRVEQEAAGS